MNSSHITPGLQRTSVLMLPVLYRILGSNASSE
jgi:hypothetical protein